MKIIELFAGIGACSVALKRLGIDVEIVDAVENDKFALASFNAIHGTNFELQDITKYDKTFDNIDLICHGSPCQDFSLAGKQAGGDKDSGTRSSLMYETLRIVERIKPKYVLWENVKNILSKKHIHNFNAYLDKMQQLGYTNYWKVLNAKDYGIPQNRERVYTISILGNKNFKFPKEKSCNNKIKVVGNYMPSGYDASRIVDENGIAPTVKENHGTVTAVAINFKFPKKEPLKIRLKDVLEDEVDEKYYLSDEKVEKIQNSNFTQEKEMIQDKDYGDTLLARDWKDPKCVQIGNLKGGKWDKINESCRRVYSENGISPTVHTCQGGNTEPKIAIKNATKKGYSEAVEGDSINLSYPNSKTRRGRVGKQVAQTLRGNASMGVLEVINIPQKVKVRKYPVDTEKLVKILRKQKELIGWTNKELANKLNVSSTKVEHWFRTDESFAIPSSEKWKDLKKFLKIKTNEFDKAILTFEEREGIYEKSNRCYYEKRYKSYYNFYKWE